MISEREKNLRKRRKVKRNQKIINMYDSCEYSLRELGRIFDISHQRVHKIIKKAGIDGTAVYMERNRRNYTYDYCKHCGERYRMIPSVKQSYCSYKCSWAAQRHYTTSELIEYVRYLYHRYGKIDVKLIREKAPPSYVALVKYLGKMKEIRAIAKGEKNVSP